MAVPTVSVDELDAIEGLHEQVLPEYRQYIHDDPELPEDAVKLFL